MGRRTSSGRIGAPAFGGLLADAETITSDDNKDIIIDPTGTGRVVIDGLIVIQGQNSLRFNDVDNSSYVGLQAPSDVTSDITFRLPQADGTNGQVLSTDGSGNLSFSSAGVSITDDTADSNTNYIPLTTATSGAATAFDVATTKLSFIPSTGVLTADGGLTTGNTGTVTMGSQTRQNINLFSTSYGIGVQSSTHYFRTGGRFSWFSGGTHNDNENNPGSGGTTLMSLDSSGQLISYNHHLPNSNNSFDLGGSSNRWRTIYTTDLELSNGIGDYTIVEGKEDLFLYNNNNGKTYKFLVQEVDPNIVPPKKAASNNYGE